MTIAAAIAMNRFGLGARAAQTSPDRPKSWLLDQLTNYNATPSVIASQPSRRDIAAAYQAYRAKSRMMRKAEKNEPAGYDNAAAEEQRKITRRALRDTYASAVGARLSAAVNSEADFAERLVHFWSNHFAVSADNLQTTVWAGNYEFEAIRPNILGRFKDLLGAAIAHPAMLVFLDQAQSIGPNSAVAQRVARRRNRELGLNENLAREILELHTLGVRTGYSQADVTEFARALTGMTVAGITEGPIGRLSRGQEVGDIFFLDAIPEPGSRQIMDKTYDGDGSAQVQAIISDLSTHPATARHIATKLARHFVSDRPPPALVTRLESSFLKTGGDLPALYQILVEAPEAWPDQWNAGAAKFKSPWEWVISSLRAVDSDRLPGNGNMIAVFRQMGQPIWKPGSPAGYIDNNATWTGGSALIRRVELAARIARRNGRNIDARSLASQILPGVLSLNTIENIAGAESSDQGLSLLLASPEFLRR